MSGFDIEKVLSPVVTNIPPSGIRKFFDIVSEMKDAISLGVGEPDFVTPRISARRASPRSRMDIRTIPLTPVWPSCGHKSRRTWSRRFSLKYDGAHEILVSVGGSEAIDLALRAILCPGDEVLIPEPSFVCYKPDTELAGGVAVPLETKEEHNFALTPDTLRAAITPRTKALVLPYPNNPTGGIMTKREVEAIAEVLEGTNILVISDEIYAELTYGRRVPLLDCADSVHEGAHGNCERLFKGVRP